MERCHIEIQAEHSGDLCSYFQLIYGSRNGLCETSQEFTTATLEVPGSTIRRTSKGVLCACDRARVCVYICVCTYVCTYVGVHMWVYICVCTYVGVHMWVYICGCTYVCVHMCVYICVCTYVCIHICVYICGCTYVCVCSLRLHVKHCSVGKSERAGEFSFLRILRRPWWAPSIRRQYKISI
jgi:hypothetical protein